VRAEGAINPLHHLAYRCHGVKSGGSNSARIVGGWQKRLYIFAGFVDYPKAELGRVVRRHPMGVQAVPACRESVREEIGAGAAWQPGCLPSEFGRKSFPGKINRKTV
jgi:hypothetical protein